MRTQGEYSIMSEDALWMQLGEFHQLVWGTPALKQKCFRQIPRLKHQRPSETLISQNMFRATFYLNGFSVSTSICTYFSSQQYKLHHWHNAISLSTHQSATKSLFHNIGLILFTAIRIASFKTGYSPSTKLSFRHSFQQLLLLPSAPETVADSLIRMNQTGNTQ